MIKTYPTYLPSGIDWLGEIPSHWKSTRFKYFLEQITTPSLSTKKVGLENIESATGQYIETSSEFEGNGVEFFVGDILYGKLRPYLQKVWLAAFDGNAVGDFFVYRPMSNAKSEYIKWLMLSDSFTKIANQFTNGAKMPRVSNDFIKNLPYYLPPIEEQEAIAGYLDEVTAKVDTLMAEKRAQVEDLRKYRTSLITETVTRGLNPNVSIKQTNSEWFPNIPTNWSIEKFKYQATVKANLVHPTDYIKHPQISPDSIEKNTGRLLGYKSVEEAGIISDNHLFYKGQIIYSKIRPNLNKVIIAPFDGLCSADMYPIETLNNVRYFQYLMLSNPFVSQVSVVIQDRVKMPKINQVELGEILILVPPISEQQQIADYLDEKTAKIDSLVEELEAQISDLATYRQAVITEAVTGKIDVREWSNPSKN